MQGDVKDQIRISRNPILSLTTIRQISRNQQTSGATSFHADNAFVPAHRVLDWEAAEKGLPLLPIVDKDLTRNDNGLTHTNLVRVDLLCRYLGQQATAVFHQIAEAEKRNVLFGLAVSLGVFKISPRIMRVCPEDSSHCRVYIAAISSKTSDSRKYTLLFDLILHFTLLTSSTVNLFSIQLRIENGISTQTSLTRATIDFHDVQITSMAFLDDQNLLVLAAANGETPKLFRIAYSTSSPFLSYKEDHELIAYRLGNLEQQIPTYTFPGSGSFVPDELSIGEQNRKRSEEGGARICVLDKGRMQYRVFTMKDKALVATGDKDDDGDEDVQMTQE